MLFELTDTGDSALRIQWWRPVALAALVALLAALSYSFDLVDHILLLQDWIHAQGLSGIAVFIALFAMATLAGAPGSPLTAAAGALLGIVWGTLVASIGSLISACLAFLIARHAARRPIEQWMSKKQSFRKMDKLAAKHGAGLIALTRMVPILPLPVVNYGYGLTAIRFSTYAIWSWLCMLPGIILFVAGADILTEMLVEKEFRWSFVAVIAVRVMILAMLFPKVRQIYREYQQPAAEGLHHEKTL
ncbi:MAG: TVP38/TMEM64 family protein [Planctomycetota bacterium]